MIWAPHIRETGNTTTDDQGHTLTYDAWNRLIAVTNSTANGGTVLALYSYDGMGRQVTQNDVGTSSTEVLYSAQWQVLFMSNSHFVWSAVDPNALVLCDDGTYAETLPVLRTYVLHDADENNTAMVQVNLTAPDVNGDSYIDISDINRVTSNWMSHTGNGDAAGDFNHDGIVDGQDLAIVVAHYFSSGWAVPTGWAVVERVVYDGYGKASFSDGDWNDDGSPNATTANFVNMPFLNNGMLFDGATGINIDRERPYKPSMERFLQPDPTGTPDGMDRYSWVTDNPINRFDPSGTVQVDTLTSTPSSAGSFSVTADLWLDKPAPPSGGYIVQQITRIEVINGQSSWVRYWEAWYVSPNRRDPDINRSQRYTDIWAEGPKPGTTGLTIVSAIVKFYVPKTCGRLGNQYGNPPLSSDPATHFSPGGSGLSGDLPSTKATTMTTASTEPIWWENDSDNGEQMALRGLTIYWNAKGIGGGGAPLFSGQDPTTGARVLNGYPTVVPTPIYQGP